MVMESGASASGSGSLGTSGVSSSHGDGVFSRIVGNIDTIVSVLDTGLDAPKEREALKVQLAEFKDQIAVWESQVRVKQREKQSLEVASQPSLDISLTSLQRNVDLVARSLGIDPVWHSGDEKKGAAGVTKRSGSASVFVHCWNFKQKTKKVLHISASCKSLRAFSLRLAGHLHFSAKRSPFWRVKHFVIFLLFCCELSLSR